MEQALAKNRSSLRLTRFFPVAPEKAWRAWTEPEALKRWFGPGAADKVSVAELDVRVGGKLRIVLRDPEGVYHDVRGVYKEVVPNRTPGRMSLVTSFFKPAAGGTDLEFRHEQHFDETVRDNHKRGWSESFVKLEAFLQQA